MPLSDTSSCAPDAYAYPLLVRQLLHTPLATAPEQEIVCGERRHTYRGLRDRIGRLAGALRAAGIRPGQTVAVMDWDSHRYLEAYFAVPMMGAVLMTVNVRLSPEQILYTLNHSGARALLVHRDFLPVLAALREQLGTVEVFVLLDDGAAGREPTPAGFRGEYESLLATASPDFAFPELDENTRATTFYTTGTTGLPKGVFFTHRQLVLHTLAAAAAFGTAATQGRLHREDVYMPITPMFHVHAWGLPYVATLLGLKQVYPGRYTPDGLLALVRREGVSFSHCVPTVLHMLLGHPASLGTDLAGWKVVIGGSALPQALAEAALARGIDLFAGYGMSETCPILTLAQVRGADDLDPGRLTELRRHAGWPIPLVELRTVDERMDDVPRDGESAGEVVARAPWLTQGYYRQPDASAALWAGGYLHTNDIGVIDASGGLRITDRLKDVIKTGGEWVSSLTLEDLLSRHPSVQEAAVIGVPDPRWGERPLALVVLKPGHADDDAAMEVLQAHLRTFADAGDIPRYAVPERMLVVDAIARTSVGKLDKKKLRELFAQAA